MRPVVASAVRSSSAITPAKSTRSGGNAYLLFSTVTNVSMPRLMFPLALATVAGSIRRSSRFGRQDRIVICDTEAEVYRQIRKNSNQQIHVLVSSVQMIRGVTVNTNTAIRFIRRLKARYPGVVTMVGGPDVSLTPDLYRPYFDIVFEGEVGAVDLLEVIAAGGVRHAAQDVDPNDETVDWDLLQGRTYRAGLLQTTRGCPHRCDFCNIGHLYGRKPRFLRDEVLLRRLEDLARVHRGPVFIGDDNFGGGVPAAAGRILDVLIRFQRENGYPFLFIVQCAVDFADHPDIVEKFRDANVAGVFLGIESPSVAALQGVGKNPNLGRSLEDRVRTWTRSGMIPVLSFILGLDDEPDDIRKRLQHFIERCGTPLFQVNLLNPVEGSAFRPVAEAEGRLLPDPVYFEHTLIPMKTRRDYVRIHRDYRDINAWAYRPRRILGLTKRVLADTRQGRDSAISKVFMDRVSRLTLVKLSFVYAVLCLRARLPRGWLLLGRLPFLRKAEIFDSLVVGGAVMVMCAEIGRLSRRVGRGMIVLKEKGLYPYPVK
jgi:radical SAM superfamily enzyme YgiQ (UPF0313 family)